MYNNNIAMYEWFNIYSDTMVKKYAIVDKNIVNSSSMSKLIIVRMIMLHNEIYIKNLLGFWIKMKPDSRFVSVDTLEVGRSLLLTAALTGIKTDPSTQFQ